MVDHSEEPHSEITPSIDLGAELETAPQASLEAGDSLGRYAILGLAGHGGMGQIYAAYDPNLDRRVALKLLRTRGRHGAGGQRLQTRLLQEAKTLARLAHPNVVTVFDVGAVGDQIFVAMEYVDGSDLAQWLAEGERSLEEILTLFLDAGRGLAAAHEAGIVHRDFKPGNVLVGKDGRVRVCDFGLAQSADDGVSDLSPSTVSLDQLAGANAADVQNLAEPDLSRRGAALGTPGYRAPEQRGGESVGPSADQYSFCVALFRALYQRWPDEPPPATPESGSLAASLPGHPGSMATAGAGQVPTHIELALRRGLDSEPEQRFPSMAALLEALAPRPRSRAWVFAAVALTALIAGALGLWLPDGAARACSGGASRMAEIWNPLIKQSLTQTFRGPGEERGAALTPLLFGSLDAYAGRWAGKFAEICHASRRGEQSDALLDRRMACLEVRRQELRWMVVELEKEGSAEAVANALAELPALGQCDDRAALLSPLAAPDGLTKEAVASVRRDLAAVRAQRLAGRYDSGLENVAAAIEAARGIGYWPLIAEALFERGRILEHGAQNEEAAKIYGDVLLAAEAGRHDRVAVDAFLRLIRLAGYETLELERAEEYADMATALLGTLGERRRLQATLENHLGLVDYQGGDYEGALQHHSRALGILGQGADTDSRDGRLQGAITHIRLGNAARALGDLDRADSAYAASQEAYVSVYGEDHPELAVVLDRRGGIALERGADELAEQFRQRAVTVLRRTFGEDHPRTLEFLNNLGSVLLKRQEYERALELFQRLEIAHGNSSNLSKSAEISGNLGSALLGLERGPEALVALEKSLAIYGETYGDTHPYTGLARFNLAEALNQLGQYEEALGHHRRALGDWRRRLGDRHFFVAHGTTGVGRSLLELGRHQRALESLRKASELWDALGRDPFYGAECSWFLSRALEAVGRRDEAIEEAEKALRGLGDGRHGELVAEIESWLATRGVERPEASPAEQDQLPGA